MQLSESQVSASKLADIFNQAFIDTSDLDSNEFKVKGETVPVGIEVDSDRKLIKMRIVEILAGLSLPEAASIMNEINSQRILAKFSAVEYEGHIFLDADYVMSYEKGLIAYHLISNVKFFEKIVVASIREYLLDYLR